MDNIHFIGDGRMHPVICPFDELMRFADSVQLETLRNSGIPIDYLIEEAVKIALFNPMVLSSEACREQIDFEDLFAVISGSLEDDLYGEIIDKDYFNKRVYELYLIACSVIAAIYIAIVNSIMDIKRTFRLGEVVDDVTVQKYFGDAAVINIIIADQRASSTLRGSSDIPYSPVTGIPAGGL